MKRAPFHLPQSGIVFEWAYPRGSDTLHRLAGYRQVDGQFIAAEECCCQKKNPFSCPIDEHAIRARMQDVTGGEI